MRSFFEKIFLAMALALACTLVACNRKPSATGKVPAMSVFSDAANGYRISYPTGWEVTPKTERIGVSFSSTSVVPGTNSHPYMSVFQQPTVQKDVREIVKALREDQTAEHNDYVGINESDVLLAGHTGRKVVYRRSQNGFPFEFTQAFVVIDEKTFIFTCVCSPEAFPAVEPTISAFLQSFAVTTK